MRLSHCGFAVLLLASLHLPAAANQTVATFTLTDHLHREWRHEPVFFPVAAGVYGREGLALVGPEEKSVLYQWVPAEAAPSGKNSIAFFASISELEESVYRLVSGTPPGGSDLRVQEGKGIVTLQNGRTGITIGGPRAGQQGPIAGIRLPSGRNAVTGQLDIPIRVEGFKVEVLAAGPVFAAVAAEYTFPDHRYWRLRFRMFAGEPVILVDEQFTLPNGAKYTLQLADGWGANQLFYRDQGNCCQVKPAAMLPAEKGFRIEPWPIWWEDFHAHWLAVHLGSGDLLALAVREPGDWVIPGRTEWDTAVTVDRQLQATFPLQGFERKWMFVAMKHSEAVLPEQVGERVTPPPQQYVIKYDDVALDRVKDWKLEWQTRGLRRPQLFTTSEELAVFRERFPVAQERLETLRTTKPYGYQLTDHVSYYLATGDEGVGKQLAAFALETLQAAVDSLATQDELRNQGSCPHHRTRSIYWSAIAADLVLGSKALSPEEEQRLRAQLAFLGYTLARPTFISPERGFKANPNMTSSARGMLGIVACTIPQQPNAKNWAELSIGEMKEELETWCGPNGGWLEAPHYMTVSMDGLMSLALALRGKGFTDEAWHLHPSFKAAVHWLAKISTPPDLRLDGHRHMPAIGNTYLGEPSCLFGWMATVWQEADPAYARNMQWMWLEHGKPLTPGIGGAYPGFQGYETLLLNTDLPAAPPRWQSELFPSAGAVFRAHFPSERETYMHYIQGPMHQHYDFDEGSFILWGKGRPLCEDFGYYGRAPASDHSRVDDGFYEALGLEGRIHEFASGRSTDYLRGERHGWHRQILFVKDDDPLGPNYAVLRDTLTSGKPYEWRVWIATDEPLRTDRNPIRAKGRFDVDLAVYFLEPSRPVLSAEQASRTAGTAGWGHDKRTTTQCCLRMKIPADQPTAVVLYPLMQDQKTPTFTPLAGGRGVKIASDFETDYVLLNLQAFQFSADDVELDGKAGVVQVRPKGTQLALPRRGSLSYRGSKVEAAEDPVSTLVRQVR